jgi:SAM-dependent methyltransferase
MKKINQILEELYNFNSYGKYKNKTQFKEEYSSVYGEVTKNSTNAIVNRFKKHFNDDTVFYDIGSGLGKMVLHIALQYNPKKSCGIEFSKERIEGANFLLEKYGKNNDKIEFIEGDFLEQNYDDATVVYCDNTMYNSELTTKIVNLLPINCLFICRRKFDNFPLVKLGNKSFATTYKTTKIYYFLKK